MNNDDEDQINLLIKTIELKKKKNRLRDFTWKSKKEIESLNALHEGRKNGS